MNSVLAIPSTLKVIIKCWEDAETELLKVIEKKYRDVDEEIVTVLFYGELSYLLREASQRKAFERAFLDDLRRAFPRLRSSRLLSVYSENLIADVSLHRRH